MLTEKANPNTTHIDRLDTLEILKKINQEDQLVALAVEKTLPQIAQAVDAIVSKMQAGGRLIYSGAGTSGRLGMLDAVESMPTFSTPKGLIIGLIAGGDPALTQAVENAEDNRQAGADDLANINLSKNDSVIGIAASGTTPYVLGALEYARSIGALTIGISCNVPAPILDQADYGIGVPVGPEVITGSTRMKAGTAQKLVLNMMSSTIMIRLGKVYGNLMVDVQVTNEKLARRARNLVSQLTGLNADDAQELLNQSGNRVKVAVVMHKRQLSAEQAMQALDEVGGNLHQLID